MLPNVWTSPNPPASVRADLEDCACCAMPAPLRCRPVEPYARKGERSVGAFSFVWPPEREDLAPSACKPVQELVSTAVRVDLENRPNIVFAAAFRGRPVEC